MKKKNEAALFKTQSKSAISSKPSLLEDPSLMFHQGKQCTISSRKTCKIEKKEWKSTTVSQTKAITWREWKKVKADKKEKKKHTDYYKTEKRRYRDNLQRCLEHHIQKVKIIKQHKRYNRAEPKASLRIGAKASNIVHLLFLREHFYKMTGEV